MIKEKDKPHRFNVSFHEDQFQQLKKSAKEEGHFSMSDFIRSVVMRHINTKQK